MFVPSPTWVNLVAGGILQHDGEAFCKGLNLAREERFFDPATTTALRDAAKAAATVEGVATAVRTALNGATRTQHTNKDDANEAALFVEAASRFCAVQAVRVAAGTNAAAANAKAFRGLVFTFDVLQEAHMRDRSHYDPPPRNRRGSKGTVGWDTVVLITMLQFIQHAAQELTVIDEEILGALVRNWRRLFVFLLNADLDAPKEIARRRGALPMMNALIITLFQHNNTHQCRVLLANIEERERLAEQDPLKSVLGPASHLVSEQVKFRYYQGRMKLHEKDFATAFEAFRVAFNLSPAFHEATAAQLNNKRRVLFYWVVTGITMGIAPPAEIIGADEVVSDALGPLIDAMRQGNVARYESALATNGSLLRRRGVFMLLHQGKLLCWLYLLRRVHSAMAALEGVDNSRVPIDLVVSALNLVTDNGADWAAGATPETVARWDAAYASLGARAVVLDAKRARLDTSVTFSEGDVVTLWLARLVARGLVRGYISHEHRVLVLSKKEPFPTLRER